MNYDLIKMTKTTALKSGRKLLKARIATLLQKSRQIHENYGAEVLIIVKLAEFNYVEYSSTDSDSIYFNYKANKFNLEADMPHQNNVNIEANSGRTTIIPPLKRQNKRTITSVDNTKKIN